MAAATTLTPRYGAAGKATRDRLRRDLGYFEQRRILAESELRAINARLATIRRELGLPPEIAAEQPGVGGQEDAERD